MSEVTTVYIVESDPYAREAIAAVARARGLQVQEFDSSDAFAAALPPAEQTCVFIASDAREALQPQLQHANHSLAVVIVGPADVRTAVRAMQQGAVSYLARPVDAADLSDALELALNRSNQASQRNGHVSRTRLEQLSASEREVLSRVLEGQPNRQIASDLDLGLRTVELRRSHIMRKTGAANLSELIRLAIEADFPSGIAPPPAPAEGAKRATDSGESGPG